MIKADFTYETDGKTPCVYCGISAFSHAHKKGSKPKDFIDAQFRCPHGVFVTPLKECKKCKKQYKAMKEGFDEADKFIEQARASDASNPKQPPRLICKHCGEDKAIRNKSGYCDHLYFPDNCEVCKGEEEGLYTISSKKFKTLNAAMVQLVKWDKKGTLDKKAHIYRVVEVIPKITKNNKLHKQGYDDAKEAILNDLRQIVERNEWMGGYDFDGIAEGVLRYLKLIE